MLVDVDKPCPRCGRADSLWVYDYPFENGTIGRFIECRICIYGERIIFDKEIRDLADLVEIASDETSIVKHA